MEARFRLHRCLAIVSLGVLLSFATNSYGQLFEFCDDFTKPCRCQRNPYEERMETERHDFTQSAVTVGCGVVQLEGGYTYFYKDTEEEIEHAHAFPETMLRLGLSEDIEFRLRWTYAWEFIDEGHDHHERSGSEDLHYSLKLQMTRQECCGCLPTSALELVGSAPTGDEFFTTDQAEFGLDYIYQWELCDGVTLAGSTGFGTNGLGLLPKESPEDDFLAMSQSAVLGFEISESNALYTEWYGIFSDGREDELVVSVFNVGLDHYFTDDFVIDFRVGVGLSDDSDDLFAGVGGGYRL